MTNKKQELDIETSEDGIVARRDDFFGRPDSSEKRQQPLSPPEKVSTSQGPATWLTSVTLAIALVAAAGSGWLGMQHQAQTEQLNQAQARILDLEQRLSATGEEMDESSLALKVKVTELSKKSDELWTQMDKLWASAWRRNQSEIKELETALETTTTSASKKLDAFSEQVRNLKTSLNAITTNYDILKEELDVNLKSRSNIESSVVSLKQSTTANDKALESLEKQVQEVLKQTDQMQKRLVALEIWQTNSGAPGK